MSDPIASFKSLYQGLLNENNEEIAGIEDGSIPVRSVTSNGPVSKEAAIAGIDQRNNNLRDGIRTCDEIIEGRAAADE